MSSLMSSHIRKLFRGQRFCQVAVRAHIQAWAAKSIHVAKMTVLQQFQAWLQSDQAFEKRDKTWAKLVPPPSAAIEYT